ncbi:MAG: MerR family transcriptional regulator [Thermodesulfobacteriota bacterium]
MPEGLKVNIPEKLYYKIGEVARLTNVKPYVLRYWESEFKIIKPKKSLTNQRIYSKSDLEIILEIKRLLQKEKYTLNGAKKAIKKFNGEKEKQIDIPFPDKKYRKELLAVKKELEGIKKLLEG